jgi:hydroxylysine kinase
MFVADFFPEHKDYHRKRRQLALSSCNMIYHLQKTRFKETGLLNMDDLENLLRPKDALTTRSVAMTVKEAISLSSQLYGLRVEAKELRSERDQNFVLIVDGSPKFLLKLANAAEAQTTISFRVDALRHMERVAPDLPIQRVIQTLGGEDIFEWRAGGGQLRFGYLLSYLDGAPMAGDAASAEQQTGLGLIAAKVGQALSGFNHPAASHELLWDLKHAAKLRAFLDLTDVALHRTLAAKALDRFDSLALAPLRHQVIHNDLNPHNVLVSPETGRIAGVIDFGDMVQSPLACDVAVACSYLFASSSDPLAPLCRFLAAYASVLPLHQDEIDALLVLIAARLAMTVIITNWRAKEYPENRDYILRNQKSAVTGMLALAALPADQVKERFQIAAQGGLA